MSLGLIKEATVTEPAGEFDVQAIQERWLPIWDEIEPFATRDLADAGEPMYVLDMFPYPSGDLHMGHAEAYAIGDVVARYWIQQGRNVMHPIGWDAFGLPAENAAIKRGVDPAVWTYANIEQQKTSMRRYACSFDWNRVLNTCDPEYYAWNQWLFLQMYDRGLAYRKDSSVNWCPNCQTVLANEQVVGGQCERCDTLVTKKDLNQWYLRITDYAERLLRDMDQLEAGWPEKVLSMQRNWIGKSTGATVQFEIEERVEAVSVYTTRPDTLYGATFFVVAADSPLASELVQGTAAEAEFADYLVQARAISDIDRLSIERPKTGLFLERYAINPVNGERLPIWAADYVLADYGTGAIMAVPAHDQRDLDFARTYSLPIRVVVDAGEDPAQTGVAIADNGPHINSGPLDGMDKNDAIARITSVLEGRGTGEPSVNYRLRDWLISRQRYWGTPIPIIHCPNCGEVPVPLSDLPVRLPDAADLDLKPKGTSPLGAATEWSSVLCPECGEPAQRDADTMDTFVDSSWYFLRFLDPHNSEAPFDPEVAKTWMPVDQYVGGVTHAILHLLYARFFTKVLYDMGLLEFNEPFTKLLNQGMILMDGFAMSKSRGNLVKLTDELDTNGVDAVRIAMIFAGPPEDDVDWADVSAAGAKRFLARAWRLSQDVGNAVDTSVAHDPKLGDRTVRQDTHRTVNDASVAVESHRFNVAVARTMELVNGLRKAIDSGPGAADPAVREGVEAVAILLSLVAPYTSEDMWSALGHQPSVARAGWPDVDPDLLKQDLVTCVVQVAGKVKARLSVSPEISTEELESLALSAPEIVGALADTPPRRVIVRAPKLVNIVPA
jgi:leucyl-tRNA synthetase